MYESFFGLTGLPFKITPDDRVFYGGAQRQDMLDALIYTLERGEGLVTVIGEVGAGKTTLARVLAKRLPETVKLVSIYMPNVEPLDMLYMIGQALELDIPAQQPKYIVLEKLREYLLAQQALGIRILLLVDEAQTISLETLEELRLLSNMQSDDFKLLQIMLFGQPELEQLLELPNVRQVKDRIVYHLDLKPFSLQEVSEYLEFRMRVVGYRGERFFSPDIVMAIYKSTNGFARAINKLADQILMSAFAQQSKQLTLAHVNFSINTGSVQFRESVPSWTQKLSQLQDTHAIFELFGTLKQALFSKEKGSLSIQVILAIFALIIVILVFNALFSNVPEAQPLVSQDAAITSTTEVSVATQPALVAETNPLVVQKSLPVANLSLTTPETKQIALVDSATVTSEKTEQLQVDAYPVSKQTAQVVIAKKNPLSYWQNNHEQTRSALAQLAKEDAYTIQLMSDPWRLRDEFNVIVHSIQEKLPKRTVFVTDYVLSDARARIAMLYGVYNTQFEAQNALRELPTFAKTYNPIVVSFKQASEQIRQSVALQTEP